MALSPVALVILAALAVVGIVAALSLAPKDATTESARAAADPADVGRAHVRGEERQGLGDAGETDDVEDAAADTLTGEASATDAGAASTAVGLDEASGYRLTGRAHVHQEQVHDRVVTVVSITLDSPITYTSEYKGDTYDDTAAEVGISWGAADDAEVVSWSAYDGKHITVAASSLREAYHDASYLGIDALVDGDAEVVSVDEGEAPVTGAVYTVRYDLRGLKRDGGTGDIGGIYVPGTITEYRMHYGSEGRLDIGDTFIARGAIPGTDLQILYMIVSRGEGFEDEAAAYGIEGRLSKLVDGLPEGESVHLYDLASRLQSSTGACDAQGMLPELLSEVFDKQGLCYVSNDYEIMHEGFVCYAEAGSTWLRELRVQGLRDGRLTADATASITLLYTE